MTTPRMIITARRPALLAGHDNELDVLVRVQAPDQMSLVVYDSDVETLAPLTKDDVTSRVILLSDGCANEGLTEPDAIYAQCADLARAGVSTSTYGLGDAAR